MTTQQKTAITAMRRSGASYIEIAQRLGLSVNTVKSYGRRCGASAPEQGCKQCGKAIQSQPGRKLKRFCSDSCRFKWWNANKALLKTAKLLTCPCCGATFTARITRKYCCHPCYVRARFGDRQVKKTGRCSVAS